MPDEERRVNPQCIQKSALLIANEVGQKSLKANKENQRSVEVEGECYLWKRVHSTFDINKDKVLINGMDKNKHIKPVRVLKDGKLSFKTKRLKAKKDSVVIYGAHNKKKLKIVRTDRRGRLKIKAKRFQAKKDSILIFGKDKKGKKRALLTNKKGQVKVKTIDFKNIYREIILTDEWNISSAFDVSHLKTYSFAIINKSSNDVVVELEISPNNQDYFVDLPIRTLVANEIIVLVPKRFLKYTRLKAKTKLKSKTAQLQIYLQAQY